MVYGWETLARAARLRCPIFYWGDRYTHGFAILDPLRAHFPDAASFLMDRRALLAHRQPWGEEPGPVRHDLPRLAPEVMAGCGELRFDHIRPRSSFGRTLA